MAKYDIVLLRPKANGTRGYYRYVYRTGIDGITNARAIGCKAVKGNPDTEAYIKKASADPINSLSYEVILNLWDASGTRMDGCAIVRDYVKDRNRSFMRVDTHGKIWSDRSIWS